MQPFVTESIWTEAVMDVLPIMGRGGVTIDGVKVYNPKDTPGTIAKEIFLHLGKAQAPLSWQQLERLDYAFGPFDSVQLLRGVPGKYDPRGETYELGPELLGFLGMRPTKINVERSLNFINTFIEKFNNKKPILVNKNEKEVFKKPVYVNYSLSFLMSYPNYYH